MQAEQKTYSRVVFWLVSVAGFIVFYFAVKNLFFFDEDIFIINTQSPFMQQALERSYLVKQCFKLQNLFFANNPSGYHIVSVLLHFINVFAGILLFKSLLQYFNFNNEKNSIANCQFVFFILFLFSPVHSEPLSYLLAQGVFIFTICSQLCFIFFIKGLQQKRYCIIIAALFFILSLLCYEISWMLPFMLLCIIIFKNWGNRQQLKLAVKFIIPFFFLLFLWFIIKNVFISKTLVADYGNVSLANIDLFKTCRNALVLFARNFMPPLKNTSAFILVALAVVVILSIALFKLYKSNKQFFKFSVLLLLLSVLAFAPTTLFGIDSHDSESERYVYFSSLFAMMLPGVLVTKIFSNASIQKVIIAGVVTIYVLILFNTINGYKKAGQFSKQYINELSKYCGNAKTVYTISQPSQYNGALLLRALTRLPGLVGENYTVLNEYMQYLKGVNQTKFFTVSVKELNEPPVMLQTIVKPADSLNNYFSKVSVLQNFKKESAVFAYLRSDTLFIFH